MAGLFSGTSLEQPVTCEHCGEAECVCPKDGAGVACPPGIQTPRVRREKRRGRWNSVIADVHTSPGETTSDGDLRPLLKALCKSLGTGGGISDGDAGPEIVIQGDHRDAVVAQLIAMGYQAKAAGG